MVKQSNYITLPEKKSQKMTKFSTLISIAFRAPPELPVVETAKKRETVKEIVRNHAHGNIRLQLGDWYTQEDVNARKKTFEGYSFI